jgi:nicotinamidase-related amidase
MALFQEGKESGLETWAEGIAPRDSELVIPERYPSAFFATDMSTRLQMKGVDAALVICGG